MLKHIDATDDASVAFTFEGRPITATKGDTVASALLAAGETVFRSTPVSGADRGPFCMMGVCFDCLVEIDGVPNRQACMTPVSGGMNVRRQHGAVEVDLS
jgi:predicted molibdopterin-dependent oxidoreductase YjgC